MGTPAPVPSQPRQGLPPPLRKPSGPSVRDGEGCGVVTPFDATVVRQRYEAALEALLTQVRQDPYILAAVLLGSLSHDVVWDKSDIDLLLVTAEVKAKAEGLSLTELGVNIHASLTTRSAFRKMLEGSLQGSFTHSLLTKGRLLFTRDEALGELWERRGHLGAADRAIALLQVVSGVLPGLAKAEKWYHVRGDLHYSVFWILKIMDGLAAIEVLLHGEITEREVIGQALHHNPEFFGAVYAGLLDGRKTTRTVGAALQRIGAYLRERTPVLFGPILEYLAEAEGIRSATEMNHYFSNQMGLEGLDSAYEWLADLGVIAKVGTPVRLTEKSRVDVQEAAYHYTRAVGDAPRLGGSAAAPARARSGKGDDLP